MGLHEYEPGVTYRRQRSPSNLCTTDSNRINRQVTDSRRPHDYIKPATFDGTGSWVDYKSHFEACSSLNQWTDSEKGLYLSVSLRGQAMSVLGNLPKQLTRSYEEIVVALEDRFAPANQTELYRVQLRERRQKATESLPELGQSIRRLTHLAYPTAPNDVRETLAKEQFIDARIDMDMRLRIKQARPRSLNDATRHAVELEAFVRSDKQRMESQTHLRHMVSDEPVQQNKTSVKREDELFRMISNMQKTIDELRSKVKDLKVNYVHPSNNSARDDRRGQHKLMNKTFKCYKCGTEGHLSRNCPRNHKRRNNTKGPQVSNSPQTSGVGSKPPGSIGVNKHPNEAGMFVEAHVSDIKSKLLVDTGATVTVLSKAVFDTLQGITINETTDVVQDILSAGGTPLKTYGKITITVSIGNLSFHQPMVIADITADGSLGLDFLHGNECIVDVKRKILRCNQGEFPFVFNSMFGCYRIVASESFCLPPRSKVVTSCDVIIPPGEHFTPGISLVEPSDSFIKSARTCRKNVGTE
ncbi:uncharacterized protein LOC130052872 [Ostrea edulis]|uniref:uncharacterized protein LOC130052872 n=1 Tax=Ostrea edulis TaxID=37623 RepID=UPI0024AFEF56|nr:uncharacterized protein LOC130052872 [Ostrea edulis]